MQGVSQFGMGSSCALARNSSGTMRLPTIPVRLPACGTQFRVSIFGRRMHALGTEFRIPRARVLKVVSRTMQEDGDGDETEESSWNTLPLATEETLQRMVITSSTHLLRQFSSS